MSSFHIGQEVVCINDEKTYPHTSRVPVIKGRHYIIYGISNICCSESVDVGLKNIAPYWKCSTCGKINKYTDDIWYISSSRFAPLETIPASHEKEVEKIIKESLIVKV